MRGPTSAELALHFALVTFWESLVDLEGGQEGLGVEEEGNHFATALVADDERGSGSSNLLLDLFMPGEGHLRWYY